MLKKLLLKLLKGFFAGSTLKDYFWRSARLSPAHRHDGKIKVSEHICGMRVESLGSTPARTRAPESPPMARSQKGATGRRGHPWFPKIPSPECLQQGLGCV